MNLLGDLIQQPIKITGLWELWRAFKSSSQVISSVTRPKSSTYLDQLYTTHPSFIADISVPNIEMWDHPPVFFRRKYTSRNKCDGKHEFIECRDYKILNKDKLQRDLQTTPHGTLPLNRNVLMKFWIHWKKWLLIATFHRKQSEWKDKINLPGWQLSSWKHRNKRQVA